MNARPSLIQFSLSELITVMTCVTVVLGSLWTSREVVCGVLIGVILLVLALITLALIGTGENRSFAIGFVVFALGFQTVAAAVENDVIHINATGDEMPTSRVWDLLYEPIVRHIFLKDGKPIDSSLEPSVDRRGRVTDKNGKLIGGIHFTGAGRPNMEIVDWPELPVFNTVGALLWTLLLGYGGGKFAVAVYRYQQRAQVS